MGPTASVNVVQLSGACVRHRADEVAVEEPLEIRLGFGPLANRNRLTLAIAMRTPGPDAELAIGFALAEGILRDASDLLAVVPLAANVVRLDLHPDASFDAAKLVRHGLTTSSCGLCGKTSLDAVTRDLDPLPAGFAVRAELLGELPEKLRAAQPAFARTGGLHAAGLFDARGNLLAAREDVGRHNAADKLFGHRLGESNAACILTVTSRASFELVQKAAVAGVPVFVAVGAPTSLAVELSHRANMALVGFARGASFNVYAGAERIVA